MSKRSIGLFGSLVAMMFLSATPASAASILLNGSLEDLDGTFVNTMLNYMALGAGSTAIADWTVAAATTGEMVWALTPTGDGFSASDGSFFVDLSGFGASSPNGAIEQVLTTVIGQTYTFSVDLATINDGAVSVSVGADLLTLVAGAPFVVGSTSWTPHSATFTAVASNPTLTVKKVNAGSNIVFVDNLSIAGDQVSVPEPASITLLGLGLAMLGASRSRRSLKR
jgi:hypothetical protein